MLQYIGLAVCAGAAWMLWRFVRPFVLQHPLDNIPGPPSSSAWTGNMGSVFHRHGWDFQDKLSEEYGGVVRLYGMFKQRVLFVYDPLALHHIVVKDHETIYDEPYWFVGANHLIFGPSLLATIGPHHRKQRKLLNPVFSAAHLRDITPTFYSILHRLRSALYARTESGENEIDMMRWLNRTALELIGQGGLGHSFDPLTEDVHSEFAAAIKRLVPTAWALTMWRMMTPTLTKLGPARFRRWAVERLGLRSPHIKDAIEIIDTLEDMSRKIYKSKIDALMSGDQDVKHRVSEAKDIMSILLRENMLASAEDRLSEEELIAQVSTLSFAATDTTSTAICRTLHLLAQRPDIQHKLRAEITAASHGSDIPYDDLVALPYLDAVCRETLRVYPPANLAAREAHKDAVLPLSEPIRDTNGQMIDKIAVPNNTYIVVGIRACNRSKRIWGEDALEWKPERWLAPLPQQVLDARVPGVYSHLMSFLGGGRACIGFKFSQLEMKVALAVLLESFRFSLSDKDIVWNFASPAYPTVGRDSMTASMPLIVEKVTVVQ